MDPAPRSASDSVYEHNRGRDPRRLGLKLQKMGASAFAFFRGACHRFYETLPAEGLTRDAPAAWIAGDLHLENFGSYKGDNRLEYFDLNDFDEACLAPVTWDLVRFQASLYLGTGLLGVEERAARELADLFARTYARVLGEGHARWIERRTARGAVRELLRGLKRRHQDDLLDGRAPERGGKRRLRVGGPPEQVKALPVEPARRAEVKAALAAYAKAHGKETSLRVLDVKDRVAGTGSLGLERYVILVRGAGELDEQWLLDAKVVPPSAPARTSPCRQPAWGNDAERAVQLQGWLQAVPPARLATLDVGGRPHVLRELLPSEDRVDLAAAARKSGALRDLIEDMAQVVAWAHLRAAGRRGAAGPDELMAFGRDASWRAPLGDLALRCARSSQADHAEFARAIRPAPAVLGAGIPA